MRVHVAGAAIGLGGTAYRYVLRCKPPENALGPDWQTEESELRLDGACRAECFSPDGRAILTFNRDAKSSWFALLESPTGKERCRFEMAVALDASLTHRCSFSRNGELLALAFPEGTTTVFDVRRRKVVATVRGDQGSVCCVKFGAEQTRLFTAGTDGTVLVWDLSDHLMKAKQDVNHSPAEMERLWTDLADADAAKAYRALGTLVTAPSQAMDLLREKLKPVEKVPASVIDKLISDLDDERFEIRGTASRELRRIGPQIKGALKSSLQKSGSLEQRKRVQELLAELEKREKIPNQDDLREFRAVEVLEAIGTRSARVILQSLAKGASGCTLTDDSAASLERLGVSVKDQ